MRPLPVQALAGMPAFVLGLSIVRGRAIPVVDAGALLDASGARAFTRFLVLRVGARRIALAIEKILGTRAIPSASISDLPPLLGGAREETVEAVAAVDEELLLLLRAGRIVPEAAWRALDQQGSPG